MKLVDNSRGLLVRRTPAGERRGAGRGDSCRGGEGDSCAMRGAEEGGLLPV